MNQYKIVNPKDRCVCAYITNNNVCGVPHRNPIYQLCKKHRLLAEAEQLSILKPARGPFENPFHPNNPLPSFRESSRDSDHKTIQFLNLPKGAKQMTVTISFD